MTLSRQIGINLFGRLDPLDGVRYTGVLLLEGGLHLPGDSVDALLAAHLRGFRAVLAEAS